MWVMVTWGPSPCENNTFLQLRLLAVKSRKEQLKFKNVTASGDLSGPQILSLNRAMYLQTNTKEYLRCLIIAFANIFV